MWPAWPPGAAPSRQCTHGCWGDVTTAKKGNEGVVVEKSVTQCNSAHVSFENRVKNGGFFAYALATRGLRGGPLVVGRVMRR